MESKQNILNEARRLRHEGKTYKEISQLLDGAVSVDWCKRNLKGTKQKESNQDCLNEIIEQGLRPRGVTEFEATGIVFKHYPSANTDKIRYLKRRAKELEPNILIRKDWIDFEKPNECHKSLNAFTLHLMDTVDQLVEDFCESYPNSNPWAVKHEMLKLSFSSKISKEPLAARIHKNEILAEVLEDRMQEE